MMKDDITYRSPTIYYRSPESYKKVLTFERLYGIIETFAFRERIIRFFLRKNIRETHNSRERRKRTIILRREQEKRIAEEERKEKAALKRTIARFVETKRGVPRTRTDYMNVSAYYTQKKTYRI